MTVALDYFKGRVDAAIYLINLTSQVFWGCGLLNIPTTTVLVPQGLSFAAN